MRRIRVVQLVLAAALALPSGQATAQDWLGLEPTELIYPVRGVGCYWERNEMYCSRYCYIETNGKQYCHTRLRHAYPQGPIAIGPPIGVAAPRPRYRAGARQ